jgi:squalene-hopene/tetraprenyl-beta-curcumene cyclase
MKQTIAAFTVASACLAIGGMAAAPAPSPTPATWNARAAAAYLDGRQAWWTTWTPAQRDHDTACVSCHTVLPYALSRPALAASLAERETPAAERTMLEQVVKRVRLWREVEPFYSDQTRGLPKTSESRGTEAILNALILATRDAGASSLSDDGRKAFENLWQLQLKAGSESGGWAWLDFHNEPWEAPGSQYFGNSLAAIAIGTAPGDYASTPEIQDGVKRLAAYLQSGADKSTLLNRAMIVWASAKVPGVLTVDARQRIIADLLAKQQSDGGWSAASLAGDWTRHDATPLDRASDGYATGLVTFALEQAGRPASDPAVARGRAWLIQHQDADTGSWNAASLNKARDPASDIGKFMRDAATGYAVLALTR